MSKSREQILEKLRQGKRPFPHIAPPANYRPMIPGVERDPAALLARFTQEAEKANCVVHQAPDSEAAIAVVLGLIGEDTAVSVWAMSQIPLPGLEDALTARSIAVRGLDADVRIGLTGVDAALAATGSLVVMSGNGRTRAASLLPPIHIAVVTASQILPDLEGWWAQQRKKGLEQTRQASNIVVITGPSRTADIAMQLVMGMHGPKELHIVLTL